MFTVVIKRIIVLIENIRISEILGSKHTIIFLTPILMSSIAAHKGGA